ncbi:MAG: nucleotidyltransferase domain-containing protein [archaeon]
MDKSKNEVDDFVGKIKNKFTPQEIILFGSRAKKTSFAYSDYDFIIVSEKFKGMHWLERISKIIKFWKLPYDIDVLAYTPEEYEDKKINSSTIRTALKEKYLIF